MDCVLGKVSNQSRCGASDSNFKIIDFVFPDDALNLAVTVDPASVSRNAA